MAAHWGRSHQLGLPFLFVSLLLSNAFPQAPAQDNTKPSEATQATFTLRKEVNEVLVEVVVRDQNGQAVGGLKKEDFQLADNGRQQSITGFVVRSSAAAVVETVGKKPSPTSDVKSATVPAAAPNRVRHIVLYFDDIHTSAGNLRQFGLAADKFVDSLTPGDRVAVFSAETSKSLKFSSDPAELKAEIDKIRAHPLEPEANSCPRITSYEAYLIANNLNPSVYTTVLTQAVECNCGGQDGAGRAASTATWSIGTIQGCPRDQEEVVKAMSNQIWDHVSALSKQTLANIEAVVETLGDATGERVLLIGSAGFIAGTLETQVDAITDRALSRGVVINALDAKGLFSEEAGKAEREAMSGPGQGLTGQGPASIMTARDEAENLGDKLATATAGMAQLARGTGGEFITNNNDLAGGVQRLAGVPETVYLLTFLPRRFKKDGSFHRIQVKVNTRTPHSVQARSGYFAVKRAAIEPPARQQIQASTAGPTELPKSEAAGPASTNPAVSMAASTPAMTTAPTSVNTAGQAASATTPAKGDESQPPAATPAAEPGPAPAAEMETPPPDYSAEVEGEFVAAARDQVAKYITSFADLTAPETRKFEVFDEHGFPAKARTMQSALVVYRLQTESAITLEYRDIEEVDGHAVKDHEERAVKMWQNLTNAGSAAAEEKLIYHESERFDLGVAETGFTLYEGLALNPKCAGDFVLHEGGREQRDGREVRVFAYQQVKPCDFIQYNFEMPEVFRGSPLLQSGRLWVDARSAQIVQDEREVKVEGGKGREWRVAHVLLRYGRSEFGLMVPVSITFELYYPDVKFGQVFRVPMRARLTQNYGPFSRFEVTVGQKVKVPEQ